MTVEEAKSFYVEPIGNRIRNRLGQARGWNASGFYYFRTHPQANNLEVMIAPDLAANMQAMQGGVPPEERRATIPDRNIEGPWS